MSVTSNCNALLFRLVICNCNALLLKSNFYITGHTVGSARVQRECGHRISIKWDQRRCWQHHPLATSGWLLTQNTCKCADKSWCNGHQDSGIVVVVCCTSRLISDACRLYSTRLFLYSPVRYVWASLTPDTRMCECLHELGWPSLVRRHPLQPSERVLIWVLICLICQLTKILDHPPEVRASTQQGIYTEHLHSKFRHLYSKFRHQ